MEERVGMLKEMTRDAECDGGASFDGLLVDFMEQIDATIIIRGSAQSPITNMSLHRNTKP